MNNQAKAILWIGLILIAVQLVTKWQEIKAIIFTPSTPIATGGTLLPFSPLGIPFSTIAAPGFGGGGGGGGLRFPGVTTNPGATFPKIFPPPVGGGGRKKA